MTREEAIRELKADYCGNRIICELYPDQCNREDCEIWLAIKALETQPDGDAVSRQDAIRIVDSIDTWQAGWRGDAIESLKALPSAQPDLQPTCNQLATDCISRQAAIDAVNQYNIDFPQYMERFVTELRDAMKADLKHDIEALPSAQPDITPDGTLHVSIDADVASIGRILLSQAGTQRGGLYYKDAQPVDKDTNVPCNDLISRQAALQAMDTWDKFGCDPDGKLVRYDDDKHYIPYVHYEDMVHAVKHLPSAQPERTWHSCGEPPKHHKNVLVRGIEAIGNVTVHKVMQWDVDRWRPTDYAPSIVWQEWSEI